MNSSQWSFWLKRWLKEHPVKEPPQFLQERYAQEVMMRLQARSETPFSAWLGWLFQPRPAFALGTALAGLLAIGLFLNRFTDRWIDRAAVEEAALELEMRAADQWVLAQAVPEESEAARLEEDLQFLQEMEEEEPEEPASEETHSEEDLLEELKRLDESDLALS